MRPHPLHPGKLLRASGSSGHPWATCSQWPTGACQWGRLYSCSWGLIVTLGSRGALGRGSPGARVQAPSALPLPPPHPFRTCGELSPPCGASPLRLSPAVLSKVASSLWLNLAEGGPAAPFPATCLLPAPLSPAEPKTLAWGGGRSGPGLSHRGDLPGGPDCCLPTWHQGAKHLVLDNFILGRMVCLRSAACEMELPWAHRGSQTLPGWAPTTPEAGGAGQGPSCGWNSMYVGQDLHPSSLA